MAAENRKGIACGGNWIVDLVKVVDFYPCENALANILAESVGGGGCAHNVVINLAKFDETIELYAVGVVGNDPHGDFLVAECRQFPNIDTSQLRRSSQDRTSYTDVFCVQNTGRRTFFHYRGANRLFTPACVDLDSLPVRLFHLGYLLLLDGMDQADERFHTVAARFLYELQERNIKTSIDLVSEDSDRFRQIVPPALRFANYCIINDFEAEKLSGVPIRENGTIIRRNLNKIAKALFAYGVNDLIVVHFPEGAYLSSREGLEVVQPSLELPDHFIVGSTGAGDSFCAGVLYGLYRGWTYEEALRLGVCAGAMNLRDLTTTGGIASWKETLALQKRFPFRKDIC
jgi:sugar/nucleoside kinase (ribokinase family)